MVVAASDCAATGASTLAVSSLGTSFWAGAAPLPLDAAPTFDFASCRSASLSAT